VSASALPLLLLLLLGPVRVDNLQLPQHYVLAVLPGQLSLLQQLLLLLLSPLVAEGPLVLSQVQQQ